MRRTLSLLAAAMCVGLLAGPVLSQDMRTEPVRFAPGTSGMTISDRITGRQSVLYTIGAEAGQRMQIRLSSDNLATYFNVYPPGRAPGDEALAISEITGPMIPDLNVFDGALPTSGIYTVSVYLYRNAARRGEASNYTLEISITGETGAVVEADFADGLQGGPDFWRVRAGGGLNLRDAPSGGARVLVTLPNGLEVRNLGCRMADGRRWCQVSTPEPSLSGWAAGDYLVEGSSEIATQLPGMTPVDGAEGNFDRPVGGVLPEGSAFTASGLADCNRVPGGGVQACEFGVVRDGKGGGIIMVFWPEAATRTMYFENGAPVSFDRSEADGGADMTVTREEDAFVVVIGDERYVLPDAIISGG